MEGPRFWIVWLVMLAGCTEYTLRLAEPELVLSDDAFHWDGVVVGTSETRAITLTNVGRGTLAIEPPAFADAAPGFALFELDSLLVEPSDEVELVVGFRPEWPGRFTSRIDLATSDPERPVVTLSVEGTAMEPTIDVGPDPLPFGWVPTGEQSIRTLRIGAGGSGQLRVFDLSFEDPRLDEVLGVAWPGPLPLELAAGQEALLAVTFRPLESRRYEGALEVVSNAVNPEDGVVRVVGNGDTDPDVNAPPLVEILAPSDGARAAPSQSVPLLAATFDEEDDPTALVVELRVDGGLVDTVVPDSDGSVALDATVGPTGASTLEITVVDTAGATGSDTVVVDVIDPDEPRTYTISGGADPGWSFKVDDDLRIEVDGVAVLVDANTVIDFHAPLSFDALPSSEIRIVATDAQYCKAEIDPLVLHSSLGGQQPLTAAVCRSACSGDPCFDPTFAGPWPSDYLDETRVIGIP